MKIMNQNLMNVKPCLLILILLLFLQACSEPSKNEELANEKIKQTESNLTTPVYIEGDSTWSIQERMAHYGVPGLSISVINEGEIEWTKSYGIVDKESNAPVSEQTLFQAGSISKPVAAYGALMLVQENKILLEEDVNTYLKSWKLEDNENTKENKVTVKNLLNHSAGVTVHGFLGYSPDLPVPTLVQVLNGEPPANSGAIFVNKVPEKSFRYSGGGYTILQQLMIDVENKPFPALMDELILAPLKMTNSTYSQPLTGELLNRAATGYLPDGSMTKGKRHTYPEMAAAGLWTTSEDLAKFAVNIQKSLKKENNLALSQAMTNQMLTPFVEDFTGLGVFLIKRKNEIYFGHGGWDEGFSSEMIAHKDKGYGVVILTNSNHPAFISELIRSVALSYGWDDFFPVYKKLKSDPSLLEHTAGRYRVNDNKLIEIYFDNEELKSKEIGKKVTELVKISDSTFVRRESERVIQFKENDETNEINMITRSPDDGTVVSTIPKMNEDEKLPIEFLAEGSIQKGQAAYLALKNENPEKSSIQEATLNRVGYDFLSSDNSILAKRVFKVNILLYPESSNVYDSYAEACMKLGEFDLSIENYKKSVELDPKNNHAKEQIKKMEENKENDL